MNRWKRPLYLCLAMGMLIYAVPQLSIGGGDSAAMAFGLVWLCFALMIVAAQLHEILGVDAETKEGLRQVKRMKQYQTQKKLQLRQRRYDSEG